MGKYVFEDYLYINIRYNRDCDYSMDPQGDCWLDLEATIDRQPVDLTEWIPKRFLERAKHYDFSDGELRYKSRRIWYHGDPIKDAKEIIDYLTNLGGIYQSADGVTLLAISLLKNVNVEEIDMECYHFYEKENPFREYLACWFRIPITLEIDY